MGFAFAVGNTITTPDTDSAVLSGVDLQDNVLLGSTNVPAAIYTNGTQYTIDNMGMLKKIDAAVAATSYLWYDKPAYARKYFHGLSSGVYQKKMVIVSDPDELGAVHRVTVHKCNIKMSGSYQFAGDGASALAMQAIPVADTTQATGEEYFKHEIFIADAWVEAPNPDSYIRLNGKAKIYLADVAGTSFDRVGEFNGITIGVSTDSEQLYSHENAAGGVIIDRPKQTSATIDYDAIELSVENLQIALLGSTAVASNIAASTVSATALTTVLNKYVSVGDVVGPKILKLTHGVVGGGGGAAWAVGEVVTDSTTTATATIRYIDAGNKILWLNTYSYIVL